MKVRFKIMLALLDAIRADLRRPHAFAHERVGFIAAGLAAARDELLILARDYRPVRDEEYIRDPSVGAMMSADAIRRARQWAMDDRAAIFHVHSHGGRGMPNFSGIDARESAKFVPNFVAVAPHAVHGAMVLSDTAGFGRMWQAAASETSPIATFTVVGMPITRWKAT
jgi:hypothetical protein